MAAASGLRRLTSSSLVRYVVVGGVSAVVDVGLLALCYQVLGLPLWLSTVVGFWTSVVVNFLLQRTVSFRSSVPVGRSLWRYGALLALNTGFTVLVVDVAESVGLGYAVGKGAALVVTTVWNYLLYRSWVFPRASGEAAGEAAVSAAPVASAPRPEGDQRREEGR